MIDDSGSDIAKANEPFIDLRKVSLIYGEEEQTLAIDRLNLSIERGRFVAVVGPSGCGKSTLLKLISGLIPLPKVTCLSKTQGSQGRSRRSAWLFKIRS